MIKTLYLHGDKDCLLVFKNWKNSSKNSGYTISFNVENWTYKHYEWQNISPKTYKIGSTCLTEWD